jgi:hypothetical protein
MILSFVALFVAWTILVGWFAARWGSVYGRGRVPDPIRETVVDPSRPSVPDVKLVAFESTEMDEPRRWFEPRYTTSMGTVEGDQVQLRTTNLENGGLQLVISNADGFSNQTTTIDLLRGPGSEILARAEVYEFSDNGPSQRYWKQPAGWILVSRRDWSNPSNEHPLSVRFHLVDGTEPFSPCIQGFVRVTD